VNINLDLLSSYATQSSWVLPTITLGVGPLAKGLPSSAPSWKWFDLKPKGFASPFVLPTKRIKSLTLKVALTSYSLGRSSLCALLLTLLSTWKGPSPRRLSLDFLCLGNLYLLNWSQTQSPSSKITSLSPYCFVWCISLFVIVFGVLPSHAFSSQIHP